MKSLWDICKEALIYAQSRNPVVISCFMLMGNHCHLLLTTPNSDIDKFMMNFNRKISLLINDSSGVINHKFSNRYKWSIVQDQHYLLNVYRYIYQNPVRAKLVSNCLTYPYSSIHFTRYESKKINYRPHIIYGKERAWFEKKFGDDFNKVIRNALNKEIFKPSNQTSILHINDLGNIR